MFFISFKAFKINKKNEFEIRNIIIFLIKNVNFPIKTLLFIIKITNFKYVHTYKNSFGISLW